MSVYPRISVRVIAIAFLAAQLGCKPSRPDATANDVLDSGGSSGQERDDAGNAVGSGGAAGRDAAGPGVTDSGSQADANASDAGAAARWLHTRDNKFYHADDTVFRGRGANIHDTRSCNACAYEQPDVGEVKRRIDTLVDDWGANFMRLLLESSATADGRIQWQGPLDSQAYIDEIVQIVEHIGTKPGVYVLVSLWIDPTINDMGWPTQSTIPVWRKLAAALIDKPHVMFGLVNEPESNYDGNQDSQVWDAMNATVAAIREVETQHNSPQHIIAVQGTRAWARSLAYYISHPITAGGGTNIAYETHSYLKPNAFDTNWGEAAATLPVIIGEFGPAELGDGTSMTVEDTTVMMDQAEKADVLWLAWTFHMRCPPNLLEDVSGAGCGKDKPLKPTPWGVHIRERLAEPWVQ